MPNPQYRKPGEEELGILRVRQESSGDSSKKSGRGEKTNDPLKRKSKEFEDVQDQLSANRTRLDSIKKELGSNTDRPKFKEFEDIQERLSANQARVDSIKKADRDYSEKFHKDAAAIFKFGKEAKLGLNYIQKHNELPPPKEFR